MKSHFIGNLDARNIEGKWWRLLSPLGFYSEKYNITVFAPTGFVLDFASVPRLPFAYLIAGGTGKWEATIHDVLYRFFNIIHQSDMIFFEAGIVRSNSRENQGLLPKTGRLIRSGLMAGVVTACGWAVKETAQGCLDYRRIKTCGQNCFNCEKYYPGWFLCKIDGYHPEIIEMHT
jgi:hypothetical protein